MPSKDLAPVLTTLASKTGKRFDGRTFDSRLRIQKAMYLLRELGFEPARRYAYGSYFRGPYSPALARDYYAMEAAVGAGRPAAIAAAMLDPVVEGVARGNEFLEAAASLHSFASKNPGTTATEVMRYVAGIKPQLSPILQEAWTYLAKHGLVRVPI